MKDSGKSLFAGLAVQQFSKRMKFSYALEPCMAIGKQYNIRDPLQARSQDFLKGGYVDV